MSPSPPFHHLRQVLAVWSNPAFRQHSSEAYKASASRDFAVWARGCNRAGYAAEPSLMPELSLIGIIVQSIISTDRLNRLLYNVIAVDIKRREPESLLSDIWEPLNPWDPISFLKCAALTAIINELGKLEKLIELGSSFANDLHFEASSVTVVS